MQKCGLPDVFLSRLAGFDWAGPAAGCGETNFWNISFFMTYTFDNVWFEVFIDYTFDNVCFEIRIIYCIGIDILYFHCFLTTEMFLFSIFDPDPAKLSVHRVL